MTSLSGGGKTPISDDFSKAEADWETAKYKKKDWQRHLFCMNDTQKDYRVLRNYLKSDACMDILKSYTYKRSNLQDLNRYFVDEKGNFLNIWRAILIVDEHIEDDYEKAYEYLRDLRKNRGIMSCKHINRNYEFEKLLVKVEAKAKRAEEEDAVDSMMQLLVAAAKKVVEENL